MAMGHGGAASLAAPGRTTIKASHLGAGPGLIDEDDPGRIEVEFVLQTTRSRAAFTALRRCSAACADFFAAVILRRLKNRHSVPMATATPRSSANTPAVPQA